MDLLEPFAGVETGTGLADAGEVAVTEDLGIGEVEAEAAEQFFHGDLLCFGAGVGRTTLGIESAFVADAYAVLVVVESVGAYFVLGAAGVEGAVAGDVVVIADTVIATGFMAGFELLDGETLGDSRRAAMQHDERDVTVIFHSRQIFFWLTNDGVVVYILPQLVTQKAPAMAVRTVMTKLMMFFNVSFFIMVYFFFNG